MSCLDSYNGCRYEHDEVLNFDKLTRSSFIKQIQHPAAQIQTGKSLFHLIGQTIPMMDQTQISMMTWLQGNVNTHGRRTWNPSH